MTTAQRNVLGGNDDWERADPHDSYSSHAQQDDHHFYRQQRYHQQQQEKAESYHARYFQDQEQHHQYYQQQQEAAAPPSPPQFYQQAEIREEESFYSYNPHREFMQQLQQQETTAPSTNQWWWTWLEYLTRPSWTTLVVTILVILYLQVFHDSIRDWYESYFPPHVSFAESCQALFWQTADWMRGQWQRLMEVTRYLTGRGGQAPTPRLRGSRRRTLSLPELENVNELVGNPAATKSSKKKKRKKKKSKAAKANQNLVHSDSITTVESSSDGNSMDSHDPPPTIPLPIPPTITTTTTTSSSNSSSSNRKRNSTQSARPRNREPLEPAFLNDQDYPPGWMVYHGELGVVSKPQADQWEQEQLLSSLRQNRNLAETPPTNGNKENKESLPSSNNSHKSHKSTSNHGAARAPSNASPTTHGPTSTVSAAASNNNDNSSMLSVLPSIAANG